jgi:hypothetical protein
MRDPDKLCPIMGRQMYDTKEKATAALAAQKRNLQLGKRATVYTCGDHWHTSGGTTGRRGRRKDQR